MVYHVTEPTLITVTLDVKLLADTLGCRGHFFQESIKPLCGHVGWFLKGQVNVRMVTISPISRKCHRCNPEAFALCSMFVDASIDAVKKEATTSSYLFLVYSVVVS